MSVMQPKDFKLTSVRVRGLQYSHEIQKAMFKMGFRWSYTAGKREVKNFPINGYIYVDNHCRMWQSTYQETKLTGVAGGKLKEVGYSQIIEAAKAFKEADKAKRKARHKEKQAAKSGWIEHKGGGRPSILSNNDIIDVKHRNGKEFIGIEANRSGVACSAFWRYDNFENDIVAYRMHKKETVSFSDMVADITQGATVSTEDATANTNPKKQYGVQSIPLSMWSSLGSAYGALAFHNGALKYGKANYANTPVEASIYIDGAMRHLVSWAAGEEFDPADGVPNLGGVLANVAILLEARAAGMLIDDRAKQAGYLKERVALKEIVKHLNELHADKSPKHYTLVG